MRLLRLLLCASLTLWASATLASPDEEGGGRDSLVVSLLTCSPGGEVYSLYGHTALRVRNVGNGADVVFNYGVFDFKAPHFVWRFVLGQCDYIVAAVPYAHFVSGYMERGSSVVEQRLGLSGREAWRLCSLLVENALPENCTYRYNYLTDNCTTRVRDMVARAVEGEIVWPETARPAGEGQTYRGMIHGFTEGHPWARLGDDLLLGSACDTLLTGWASLFLPYALSEGMRGAVVRDADGGERPLVVEESRLCPAQGGKAQRDAWGWLTPVAAAVMFVVLCLGALTAEMATGRMWWWLDAVVMTGIGLAGCLLCFMFFFSEHPTVDSNWQIWVLNPVPLVCMPWVVACAVRERRCGYHVWNVALLVLFLAFSAAIPQRFAQIMIPLAVGSLARSVSYCIHYKKKR